MKKKILYSILITSLLLVVSLVTVYAAFTMTHNYEASIDYHEIENMTLTNSTQESKVTFTKPGDQINITYNLTNSDEKEYMYYYSFDWGTTDYSDSPYLNMIYVYQNGEYCGMLKDYLGGGIVPKKDLPFTEYIFTGETRSTVFTFELHNEATSFPESGLSISFKISANISTTNVQSVVFANSITFDKALADLNNGGNQTLVLTSNISTSVFNVNRNMTIDLCGKTLALTSVSTLAEGVTLKVIDSRGGGSVTGEGFNISHATSLVELEAPVSKITKTSYNKTRLIEILANYYDTNNVVYANEDYDLFGYYKVYGLTATSNDVTITEGVIKAATFNSISVISVAVDGTNYEFKYVGNDYGVINTILGTHLLHLSEYMEPTNGAQVSTDLFLPNAIKELNATISWESSDTSVLSNDGIIQSEQGNIVLRATIKVMDVVFVQEYYIYIVQTDNLSKLQYLIAMVERGITLDQGTEDTSDDIVYDVTLSAIGDTAYLPVAGNEQLEHYYTLWTDGLKLGILDIKYSLEGAYQYLTLNESITSDKVVSANVALNKVTFDKAARVGITASFDNGDVHTSYITVSLDMRESELADDIFNNIQTRLNNTDVLQNILATRQTDGMLNESGNFTLPAKVDVVKVNFANTSSEYANLYKVVPVYGKDEQGNTTTEIVEYTIDIDLEQLEITDARIPIVCQILMDTVNSQGQNEVQVIKTKTLYFEVPGAITPLNYVTKYIDSDGFIRETLVLDMSIDNVARMFYSIKLQSLQQSDYPYFKKNDDGTMMDISNIDSISEIYESGKYVLGEYILTYDIENTTKLMFEFGRSFAVLNYYDLMTLNRIVAWAMSDTVSSVGNTPSICDHISYNLLWIESDGTELISDGEVAVILSYAEKYPGFKTIWESIYNPLDNILTSDEESALIEKIIDDKTYVSIMKWMTDTSGNYSLAEWLLMKDEDSGYYDVSIVEVTQQELTLLSSKIELPTSILSLANGNEEDGCTISNDEERVMIYYVLKKHPGKYSLFMNEWKTLVSRQTDTSDKISSITGQSFETYNVNTEHSIGGSTNVKVTAGATKTCYDPIFKKIYEWATHSEKDSAEGSSITAYVSSGLTEILKDNSSLLNLNNGWYKSDERFIVVIATHYGNVTTINEWSLISAYLNAYGITSLTINDNPDPYYINTEPTNPIVQVLSVSSSGTAATNNDAAYTYKFEERSSEPNAPQLTTAFWDAAITAINEKFKSAGVSAFNNYLTKAKSSTVGTIENATLTGDRIADYRANISYDEDYVLRNTFNNQIMSDFADDNPLKTYMRNYYIQTNMTMQPNDLSGENYNKILYIVNDLGDFEEIIVNIKQMGDNAPPENAYYDNLTTISPDEIKELISVDSKNEQYINAIRNSFGAYVISIDDGVVDVQLTPGYDRDISKEDQQVIYEELTEELKSDEDSRYIHLSLEKINEETVDVLSVFNHYENLKELSFRGTSANFMFDSTDTANLALNIISSNAPALTHLTMNYCGISDIKPIESLLNLTHLNIRSNYSKTEGNYKGVSNISSLITLNDLKEDASKPTLSYVNVFDTDVTLQKAEVVFGKLLDVNNDAELWLDMFGEETQYTYDLNLTGKKLAIYALSLLHEIEILTSGQMILPNKIYYQNGEEPIDVGWKVIVANSLIKITNKETYYLLERLSNGSGEVTIAAQITIDGHTEVRYFTINVKEI